MRPIDVFVSFSRADWRHAAEIDSFLRAKGLSTFVDPRDLALRALERAIDAASAVVVLIGPHGLSNTQQYERELAFARQTRDRTFRIVPVILPETTDPPFNFLNVLSWVDFSHVANVSDAPDQLEQLLTAIHGDLAAPAREDTCPYRGLDAFREEDAAFFFGRGSASEPESPIGQLMGKVRDYPFVMVVGRSGSGKSSLVYAGLLPALRRDRDRFWNILSLRPGPVPLQALAAAFNPRADDEGPTEYIMRITTEANKLRQSDPELLSRMIRQVLDQAEGKPNRLLLYIDQWEELYAETPSSLDTGPHVTDVNRFIDLLLTATRIAPVVVVATVRADFYDSLIGHPEIRSLLPAGQILLGSMSRLELEHSIVEPAKKVGLVFDPPELVQRILDEARKYEGTLPFLQYALKETWVLRKGSTMTADSYARSGGIRDAIRVTAERTFDALSPADQQAARQLFLRLVTPGDYAEDTRARAAMPVDPAQMRIVEQFASKRTRLLVTGLDRAGRPTVEVAHEMLIRTWPRLRLWVDSNRAKLRTRARVLRAKAEWEETERRDDMLLPSGLQVERARDLLGDPGDIPTDDIQEFIALSFAREEAERKEREAALARIFAHEPIAKPEYFVSYAWGDHTPEGRAREDIVDRLCEAAERRGISILRDKKMLGLGERISRFMERLARGNRVFIVLSDKYLKSPYCMSELARVWRDCRQDDEEFLRRIRVFTLDDAKIWSPRERALCAAYWRNESGELEAIIKQHGYDILGEKDYERYRLMNEFAQQIGNILATVTDILQPHTFEELERYGFADPPDANS